MLLKMRGVLASQRVFSDAFCRDLDAQVCSLPCSGANMKLPRPVYDRLYNYQRQGAVWMWNLYHKGPDPKLSFELMPPAQFGMSEG